MVADRYNTGLSWWRGKSFCFSCNAKLGFNDLFPIVSFVFLKAKCRYCSSKIPAIVLWTEIIMGVLSVLAFYKFGFSLSYLIFVSIFATILLITIYDLRHFIIPDFFLITLLFLAFIYVLIFDLSIFQSFLSAVLLALPFLILFLISEGRWLGLGDVKYIAVIGFLLGLVQGLSAVVIAFWTGAACALLLLFVFKKNLTMKSEVPFGPFLSIGIFLSFYFNIDLFHLNEFFNFF